MLPRTPTLKILQLSQSNEEQGTKPVVFVHFDQKINPEKIAEITKITVNGVIGKKTHSPAKVLSVAEATSLDFNIQSLLDPTVKEGYFVLLTSTKPLTNSTECTFKVGPNVMRIILFSFFSHFLILDSFIRRALSF